VSHLAHPALSRAYKLHAVTLITPLTLHPCRPSAFVPPTSPPDNQSEPHDWHPRGSQG
jgi:hypothetical protein